MLCNITLCKACLNRLVGRNKFVRFKSHYAVLGVTQKATQKEIRDAYIKLSKQMHPDQNRQDIKSHDKFVQINEAYEVLGKDSSRRDYDEKLRLQYPKPASNPYKASRPSNYYSSGQFYEGHYRRTGFDPSNPYARRSSTGFESDPFSDTNYDHSFYQRKRREEEGDGPHGVDESFYQKVIKIYAYVFAIPFFIGGFYGLGSRKKDEVEPPDDITVIMVTIGVLVSVVLYIEMTVHISKQQKLENPSVNRTLLLLLTLLVLPYVLLRLWIIHSILSKKANVNFTYSERKPRPTVKPMTTEERRAAEEKMRANRQFVYYGFSAFCVVLILAQIFFEDDYLVKRQEETAGVTWKPEPSLKNDPVLKTFDRIFQLMALAMFCYLMKELVYSVYLEYVTRKLKEDLERRKKIEEQRNAEKIVRSVYRTPGKGSS